MPTSPGTLLLAARALQLPRALSEQAQAALIAQIAAPALPSPDSADAAIWRACIEQVDAALTEQMQHLAHLSMAATGCESVAGRPLYMAEPPGAPADAAYLDMHGGALVFLGGEPCRLMGRGAALTTGLRTYSIDYRMPPDHPFPAALDDCVAAYRWLLERHAPQNVVIGGVSAGGNLAAALALRLRDEGLPRPAGVVLLTPELDLTESGDSFQMLRGVDSVLKAPLMPANKLYAGSMPLEHTLVSPLFGDVTGFPPTFLQAGTRDLFLSNAVRFHRALRRAGVAAELHVFEGMPHGGFGGAPEDEELAAEVRRFVRERVTR